MADYPSTTKWLTPEERLLAAQRLAHDGIGEAQGFGERIKELVALKMTVKDYRVWVLALLYAFITGAQTMQYFIPTLVGSFGWTGWDGQCECNEIARTVPLAILTKTFQITRSPRMRSRSSALCLSPGSQTTTRTNPSSSPSSPGSQQSSSSWWQSPEQIPCDVRRLLATSHMPRPSTN